MSRTKHWICGRQARGVKCGAINPPRTRKCHACGKARPARRRPKHMTALALTYDNYVELNGGDFCFICFKPRGTGRRLDRDHDHKTGRPRGLLCHRCNRLLPSWVTPQWLRRAAYYLERSVA